MVKKEYITRSEFLYFLLAWLICNFFIGIGLLLAWSDLPSFKILFG